MKTHFAYWIGGWFYVGTTALLIAGLVVSVAGAGVSAYSSYQQGQAQKRLQEYNAQLEANQAATNRRDANLAANNARAQNERILAKQRAGFAQSGVTLDTGSPLLIETEQAGYLELAASNVSYSGDVQAGRHEQQAILDKMSGSAAAKAGSMNATASILQGVGSAASGAANAQYQGIL